MQLTLGVVAFALVSSAVGSFIVGLVFTLFDSRRILEKYRGDVVLDAVRRPARFNPNLNQLVQWAEATEEPDGYDRPVKRIYLPNTFWCACRDIIREMKSTHHPVDNQ